MESMEMWHQVGFLADAFNVFREHGISVDLISTSESNVTVSIDTAQNVTTRAAIEALADDLRKLCKVAIIGDCAAITLVGQRIRTILHELAPGARGVPGAAGPPRDAGGQRPEPARSSSAPSTRIGSCSTCTACSSTSSRAACSARRGSSSRAAPRRRRPLPKPWWVKKKAQLLEIGAQRDATYVYDRESIESAVAALRGSEGRRRRVLRDEGEPESRNPASSSTRAD